MNESYYKLTLEKQNKIINAGYKAFALYSYKKASMSYIADEANISKSLLFYYFKNKKEYYLFLFDNAIQFIKNHKKQYASDKKQDLFDLVNNTIEFRMEMLYSFPYAYRFITKAYYEIYSELDDELSIRKNKMIHIGKDEILDIVEYDRLKNPCDMKNLINMIFYIADGCMRGREELNITQINEIIIDFKNMMESLKKNYYKEEYLLNK
ncbi:TetR/AcrR family transcriptional regulator [Romboutsia weinsteinii]|uniref:TetR/AcrR family transcriptional regulator n=1 Tax=Romboutsia weinsteinii TaxID=2020949 RepID=UPI001313D867|nr:TetR/AcrR family transcriptional regulator [Romboutsia weinsteinii]